MLLWQVSTPNLFIIWFIISKSKFANGYQAIIEVELSKFTTLNKDLIQEGKPCDSRRINGAYNACDFVFYMEDCRRYFNQNYDCKLSVDRFYAKENTDNVVFGEADTKPSMQMFIQDQFPSSLLLNITVWDQDDGFSRDDFIGTYRLYFTHALLTKNRLGRLGADQVDHIITIPEHSQLTLKYRAYCTDDDCRTFNFPAVAASKIQARAIPL